ncbi:unnamed protein product [Alopecurus aequalis]
MRSTRRSNRKNARPRYAEVNSDEDEEDAQCEQEDSSGDDGAEQEDDEQDAQVLDSGSSRKKKKEEGKKTPRPEHINSRCSVKAMRAIMDPFTEEKNNLVREMEFEGMLDLPRIKLSDRKFSMWLFDHVDEMASAIIIDPRRDLQFDDSDMHKVMGVPFGGARIRRNCPKYKEEAVREMLGISKSETRVNVIADILAEDYGRAMTQEERNRFKVAFAICAVTYIIAPSLKGTYFTTGYWGALYRPELIPKQDWSRFAREEILTTGSRVIGELQQGRKKANLNGCTHALQVYYVDNLDLGEENIPHNVFPRWKVYSQRLLGEIIKKDLKTPTTAAKLVWGHLMPRHASTVCYSRGLRSIDKEEDDVLRNIAGILVDKVTKYATVCRHLIQTALDDGEEENRRHSDALHGIASVANEAIGIETSKLISDIREVTDTARRGQKRSRGEDTEESEHSPTVEPQKRSMPGSMVDRDEPWGQFGSPVRPRQGIKDVVSKNNTPARVRSESSQESVDHAEANLKGLLDVINKESNLQLVVWAEHPKTTQMVASNRENRQWLYGKDSDMNKDQDQFSLGLEDDFNDVAEEAISFTAESIRDNIGHSFDTDAIVRFIFDTTGFRKSSLMTDSIEAKSPEGMTNHQLTPDVVSNQVDDGCQLLGGPSGTVRDIEITPVQTSKFKEIVPGPSPVSRKRDMAAAELDAREEIEQESINMNVIGTDGNIISQPQARKRLKPGKYARSPFVLGYDPPERAPTDAVKIYWIFFKEKENVMKDVWIISTAPKSVELTAGELRRMLANDGEIGNDLMTVVMRRYQQIDVRFARGHDEGCWRFFMDPDFANHVSQNDNLPSLKYIQDMFTGDHITFDVHECTEFVLPIKFSCIWSTYIWDFIERKIFVLDPTMNDEDESDKIMQNHHRKVADKLHKELEKCIRVFFSGWEPDMANWGMFFPKGLNTTISRSENSGVYAAHFGRNWMGNKLKRGLSQHNDGITHGRMNMLLDVLGLEGNMGLVPERYRRTLHNR